jgi:hypothetical protein
MPDEARHRLMADSLPRLEQLGAEDDVSVTVAFHPDAWRSVRLP